MALSELRDPVAYWKKLDQLPALRAGLPPFVKMAIARLLPQPRSPYRIVHRQAGVGSLGRRRFTVLADWRGGRIAREAKELLVSAWNWAKDRQTGTKILYQRVIDRAVRVPDPFLALRGNWLIRRLAPDCSRIELVSLPKSKDELKLLHAMGWDTANIHLGTPTAVGRVRQDLKKRPLKWLPKATEAMAQATIDDWKKWPKP